MLCYNNLAGCCSPSKNCPWNAVVCDALGIDYEKLYESKMNLMEEELKKLRV